MTNGREYTNHRKSTISIDQGRILSRKTSHERIELHEPDQPKPRPFKLRPLK